MLQIVAEWDDGPLQRRIAVVVASLKDIPLTLRMMGAEVKRDSARRFAQGGPGWPARTPEDGPEGHRRAAANTRARAEKALRSKLKQDVKRAVNRRRALGAVQDVSGTAGALVVGGKIQRAERALETRYAVLREFERQAAGGSNAYSLLGKKQAESLGKRIDRAYESAGDKQLLGRLAGANQVQADGSRAVVVRNVARNSRGQKFSAVHNDGGTAGHGAPQPQREFLAVTPEVVEKVQERLVAHYLKEWKRAGGG